MNAPSALERALPLIRLPTSPDRPAELLSGGAGLRCGRTGRIYPWRNGVLDLLANEVPLTQTQRVLDTPLTSWLYDVSRALLLRAIGAPDFPTEVAAIQRAQRLDGGDVLLDLACGHGVFTVELAKRVGLSGLVVGLDLSPAMLARAAAHMRRWSLENVLLIRGDAHALPFRDAAFARLNCSGGFHQFPDLPRALAELGRVASAGATLTASTFAEAPGDRYAAIKRRLTRRYKFHSVPLPRLGQQLEAAGFSDYAWSLPGGWFGYLTARKETPGTR